MYIYQPSPNSSEFTASSIVHGTVLFPIRCDGRIVGLLGHVYRSKDGVTLTRVTDKNVLERVGVAKDSLIVPLQVNGRGHGQMGLKVFLKEVTRDERGALVARVRTREDKAQTELSLRQGDRLEGAGKSFVVRNISRGGEELIPGYHTNCWLDLQPVEAEKEE